MVEILEFLADHCGFLFDRSYTFVDSKSESAHGSAMVLLESAVLRFRITHHHGELLLEFQPVRGKRTDWFSLGLLSGAFRAHRGQSEVLTPAWASFLAESIEELERKLSEPDDADELVSELKKQARVRAKELFG